MIAAPQEDSHSRDCVDAFQEKFGMRHLYLAMHAAFPLSLTPDLLHLLRDNFYNDLRGVRLDIPVEAVSDLLLSELCQESGMESYRMSPELRHYLLARLQKMPRFGPQRITELSDFMAQYYGPALSSESLDRRALAEAQLWAAQLQAQPQKALESLSKVLAQAQSVSDQNTQLRLHYFLNYFPNLEGEVAELRTYAKGNALNLMGLEREAAGAMGELRGSGGSVNIGGAVFAVPDIAGKLEAEERELERLMKGDAEVERTKEIQQQLRFLGEYDGLLDGDWEKMFKAFPQWRYASFESFSEEAESHIRVLKDRIVPIKVHLENCASVMEYLEPVLAFWGIEPTTSKAWGGRSLKQAPMEDLDFEGVEGADLMVVGVSPELLNSERFMKMERVLLGKGKLILPIILERCDWEKSPILSHPMPENSQAIEEISNNEEIIRVLQFEFSQLLLSARKERSTKRFRIQNVAIVYDVQDDNGSIGEHTRFVSLFAKYLQKEFGFESWQISLVHQVSWPYKQEEFIQYLKSNDLIIYVLSINFLVNDFLREIVKRTEENVLLGRQKSVAVYFGACPYESLIGNTPVFPSSREPISQSKNGFSMALLAVVSEIKNFVIPTLAPPKAEPLAKPSRYFCDRLDQVDTFMNVRQSNERNPQFFFIAGDEEQSHEGLGTRIQLEILEREKGHDPQFVNSKKIIFPQARNSDTAYRKLALKIYDSFGVESINDQEVSDLSFVDIWKKSNVGSNFGASETIFFHLIIYDYDYDFETIDLGSVILRMADKFFDLSPFEDEVPNIIVLWSLLYTGEGNDGDNSMNYRNRWEQLATKSSLWTLLPELGPVHKRDVRRWMQEFTPFLDPIQQDEIIRTNFGDQRTLDMVHVERMLGQILEEG